MKNFAKKFISAVVVAAIIICCMPAVVFGTVSTDKINISAGSDEASGSESSDSEDGSAAVRASEDMISASSDNAVWPEGPEIEAESAIVMDANSGLVLYEKEADKQQYPASITKIMTTLLALENCSLDETVTFSKDAVYKNEGDTSHIARDVGEEMSLEDTLYAVMLESANECAWAVAEHVCDGDEAAFVDLMNEKAAELGCTNTHFNNPNGLPDEDHYTSCRDMALISQEAIKNAMFRKIIGTKQYEIPPTNKHDEVTPLNNHHRMLNPYKGSEYLYEYCIGGKTGYTEAAENTLVTFAEKDGELLICVVMKTMSPYDDTRALFDYCYDNFDYYNISENETRIVDDSDFAEADTDAAIVLPMGANFNDTDVMISFENVSDSVLGTFVYTYGGRQVGSMDILVSDMEPDIFQFDETYQTEEEDPNVSALDRFLGEIQSIAESALAGELPTWELVIGIAILAAIVALIVIFIVSRGRRRAERRARNKRYKTIKQYKRGNRRRGRRW
ncbi:MAG: D-alanyl-D-alanine carboxypeptidase [Clostridiales bacterium]|nr:D-alanyl-D-alanine carboxypeptidase [Clostridiales bacterium]